ncbi:MAG: hypothetical protein IKM01_03290, partial [Clostridia bacterium]|nr:hypothetical protein [Clostridia bacterium]
ALTYSPAGGLSLDEKDAEAYGKRISDGGTLSIEESCMVIGNIPEYLLIEYTETGSKANLVVTFETLGVQLCNLYDKDNASIIDYMYQYLTNDVSTWKSGETPNDVENRFLKYTSGYIGTGLTLYAFYCG